MNSAYLALGFECNHHCSCCPCTALERTFSALCIEDIKEIIDIMSSQNIEHIVLSGGEPTIHKYFFEVLKYLHSKNIYISLLSNGDKFSNNDMIQMLCDSIDKGKFTITTTLHSHIAKYHEKANGSLGSFIRTINALHSLIKKNISVTIKHCITGENYTSLKNFVEFIFYEFPKNVPLQISGLDFCGINNQKSKNIVSFVDIAPHLEEAFDMIESFHCNNKKRRIDCINIPLCIVDPYYWKYFSSKKNNSYVSYASPSSNRNKYIKDVPKDIGNFSSKCNNCLVRTICGGMYKSVLDFLGSEWINPVLGNQ